MRRRQFLHAASAAVLLPVMTGMSEAGATAISPEREFLFFDARFEAARRLAASGSSRARPIAVHTDITPIWGTGLESRASGRSTCAGARRHEAHPVAVVLTLAGAAAAQVGAAEMTGKEVFEHYCSGCHAAADGPGAMQFTRTRGKDQALRLKALVAFLAK